jgi:hypothetical protein
LPPIKEWKCAVDGYFESPYPVCIHCGSQDVLRVFLTAPGFIGDKTKASDQHLKVLSRQFNVSNISNNTSQSHSPRQPDIWHPYNATKPNPGTGMNDLQELAKIRATGIDLNMLKPQLGGKYEAIGHKEDLK